MKIIKRSGAEVDFDPKKIEIAVKKANESVVNLQKTTATMLKILADLKLKEPVPEPENPTDGYL